MGYFDSALGKLRDAAIDFIRQRVKDADGQQITLDPRLVVNVDIGDVGMPTYDGVEKWSIYAARWDEDEDDVFFDVCAGEEAMTGPEPIQFEELCSADVIALADLLDTRVYSKQEEKYG